MTPRPEISQRPEGPAELLPAFRLEFNNPLRIIVVTLWRGATEDDASQWGLRHSRLGLPYSVRRLGPTEFRRTYAWPRRHDRDYDEHGVLLQDSTHACGVAQPEPAA